MCFVIPALMMEGLALVVSPLVALVEDQVTALQRLGVAATSLTSHLGAGSGLHIPRPCQPCYRHSCALAVMRGPGYLKITDSAIRQQIRQLIPGVPIPEGYPTLCNKPRFLLTTAQATSQV